MFTQLPVAKQYLTLTQGFTKPQDYLGTPAKLQAPAFGLAAIGTKGQKR